MFPPHSVRFGSTVNIAESDALLDYSQDIPRRDYGRK